MSLHINAKPGEIAERVLLPGDPLRAKWIAETFLENPVCYNKIRGMYGYTGLYKGKPVSVQGSGMGIPSALIYYHELINHYGTKTLIRVGTAGAYQEELQLRDLVLAMAASTNSAINQPKFRGASFAPTADPELFLKAVDYSRENNIAFKAGNVLSSDRFYEEDPEIFRIWAKHGVLCAEMETACLYTVAAEYKVKALSILTISDSLVTREECSPEDRESSFEEMVLMALAITQE
ncbi:purine-nucleoside phosphorylase [Poritiphilus flavus]|uniref:Uridine phosphorylase n=1 Tax=Poritiphilus flavus TaxID=2697053 RepID=A0A6L9E777_9FLAO|nr:purine-nucleoside phosphorylase [Poritiphilus flavus]NAS10484.1 purine-nucleoside phosphorylase [Poritiphilus flavus]